MTREEAISILERVAHTESKWPGTEDTLEALDMAISALRQQESVKIISNQPHRITCSRCKCVYEFDYSDLVRFTHGSSRRCPHGIDPYYGIKCPSCGKIEEIYSEKDNVRTNADRINTMNIEEKAEFLSSIAYGRETPWSYRFVETFCKECTTVHGTYESGVEDDFHECDFVDGKCPHGSDIVWWLQQPAEDSANG